MLREPLGPAAARKLIVSIVRGGGVRFSQHARQEMRADDLTLEDCLRCLRAGTVEPAELERGTWRYRVRSRSMFVVVAFRASDALVVITTWKLKR